MTANRHKNLVCIRTIFRVGERPASEELNLKPWLVLEYCIRPNHLGGLSVGKRHQIEITRDMVRNDVQCRRFGKRLEFLIRHRRIDGNDGQEPAVHPIDGIQPVARLLTGVQVTKRSEPAGRAAGVSQAVRMTLRKGEIRDATDELSLCVCVRLA